MREENVTLFDTYVQPRLLSRTEKWTSLRSPPVSYLLMLIAPSFTDAYFRETRYQLRRGYTLFDQTTQHSGKNQSLASH